MIARFRFHAVLPGLILLAASGSPSNLAWADEKADCVGAYTEGNTLSGKGDFAGAAKAFELALELAPRVFGPESVDTASVMHNLAFAYANLGQHAKAEPLYQHSLRIRESKLGHDHPEVATTLSNLADLHDRMGQYAKAESFYQRSLKINESKFGLDHIHVATNLNNLALLYVNMGQHVKAEPLYQRSLKIFESTYGLDDPTVATILNNLAFLYVKEGQYTKAEPLYRRSLRISESKLGPDDLGVTMPLNNLADLHGRMGQYAKAEALLLRSLGIRESKLGAEHRDVATIINNLAALYMTAGQYAKATPCFHRSLKIYESRLGPDHPIVATGLNNLAMLYANMGQYAQAEPLLLRSLKIRESKLGRDHPDVATALNNLAMLYHSMAQYAKAELFYQRSLKIYASKLGADHPLVATGLSNLAVLYDCMGQYTKAVPPCQFSLKIRESKFGPDHPDVATSLNNLALLYYGMGQYAKAEPLYQRSLKTFQSKLGADHPLIANNLDNLAILYAETGRWSEAVAEKEKERRLVRRHVARTLPALSEKEQLIFLQTRDESSFHIALSLGLHQRTDAPSVLASAGWLLNGKAVAQEVLAQRTLLAGQGTDPTLAELVNELLAVRRQLASLGLAVPKAKPEADDRRRLETLNQQEQELSRRLGQATGRKMSGDPWVEPAAVRKALAKEAVFVDVARLRIRDFKERKWLPPRYAAWLIPAEGQGQVAIVDLGEARRIDETIEEARKALKMAEATIREKGEAEAEEELHHVMRKLTQLLLEPLETPLGQARRLILSPDAALWLVPWGALPLADGKYALEKYEFRYCISGRDLVGQAGERLQTTAPILFANPDYDLGPREADAMTRAVLQSTAPVEQVVSSRGLGSLSRLPRVDRLPGTAEEAAAIQPSVTRYADAQTAVYQDQYALEGVFKTIHRPRILVLSTHGFFLPDQQPVRDDRRSGAIVGEGFKDHAALTAEGNPLENPLLRCGLLLAGCNRRTEEAAAGTDDGVLTGLEIVGADLRGTELVVLSACDTGLGQIRNGEGVAGLRQAFQLAGAKAVVATLWQIPDKETVDLMKAFFANLSAGQTKAEALRNAQLGQIQSRRKGFSAAHPYYWAAFTLTGD